MNSLDKTNKELLIEIQDLQQKYNILKSKFEKDIIERKLAEEALYESEGRFKKIIEQAHIAMAVVSMEGVIEYINRKAVKVFGYQHKDIPNMNRWWEQAYPDKNYREEIVADWMGRIQKALTEGGEIAGNEYQVTCKNGDIKTILISGVPVSDKIFVLFDDITGRKKAEVALLESEERFSKAYNTSPIAFMIANMEDGKVIEVNDAFTTFSGFTREEALASSTLNLKLWVHEEDRQQMVSLLREGLKVVRLETMLRSKNGNIITALFSAQVIQLGHKFCIISSVEDITERKNLEEKILKANRIYAFISQINQTIVRTRNKNKLFEEACRIAIEHGKFQMAWIGLVDMENKLVKAVNFAGVEDGYLARIKKITVSDLPEGRGPTGTAIKEGKHVVCNDIANDPRMALWKDEALKRGFRSSVALPIKTFGIVTGTFSIYASVPHFFDNEEIILLNEVTNNISYALESIETEKRRKETEESLHAITAKLETLIQVSPLAITLLDNNGNVQLWNLAAEKIFGWSAHEVIGYPNPIVPTDKQDEYNELSSQIIGGDAITNMETERKRKDGSFVYVSISSVQVCDKNGKAVGRMAIISDISDRKIVEKELINAKEKAEESDRLKTAFLQNMSHEIRTPMNAIMGFSSLLIENYDNRLKLEQFSEIINQRCSDLLEIINDILDIAKIESGQLPISIEECNLDELFAELTVFFKEYQKRIDKQQIIFRMQTQSDFTENAIVTDKVKLKQIFINLISNAFKFTNEGKIEGGCKLDKNHNLVFYVSDTGIGIPSDKHEVIFERFAQLRHEKKHTYGGTGLGLSIVKGLIELLGGKIWLESELENSSDGNAGGTTFYFSFPCKISESTHQDTVSVDETQKYHFPGKTILVVEDDLYNVVYIKEILSNTGLNIIHTEYGYEAVQIALSQSPDLVLMDIRLSDMSGYEALRQIKLRKPYLKVIAQTAYASQEDRQRSFDAGCSDYISKPLKRNILLSMVNTHLSKE
jgi:PAS domain S-box-containing protein